MRHQNTNTSKEKLNKNTRQHGAILEHLNAGSCQKNMATSLSLPPSPSQTLPFCLIALPTYRDNS